MTECVNHACAVAGVVGSPACVNADVVVGVACFAAFAFADADTPVYTYDVYNETIAGVCDIANYGTKSDLNGVTLFRVYG